MFEQILCAIEASDEGEAVLQRALELADKFGSKVTLINVIPYTFLPEDYQSKLEDEIAPKINAIAKKYGINKKNVAIKVGKPYKEICNKAEKIGADLIVLGTHSEKGITGMVGSTANGVSNFSECDVYLVNI